MISIIFCGDIRYCPYLSRYTDRLDFSQSEYEVLFWNRAGLKLNVKSEYKYYDSPSAEDLGKTKKLFDFLGFRNWVKKQLSVSKPDGIIFLSTLSGVLLWDVAKKHKKKYIFDIRDYSYENIGFFKKVETKIIGDSFFTAVSSKGFKTFLPEHEYVIAHNFNRNDMVEPYRFTKKSEPYQIVWNGTVRFFDYQKDFLNIFKNDPRFVLVYHGAGTDLELYKKYCRENGITNVTFTGAYDNRDKAKLIQNAAILNNCYGGRNGDELRFAISNRFYDGLVYHIPQIVEDGGYKADETQRLKVGLSVEPTSDLPDRLYQYYTSLNPELFNLSCETALTEIISEDDNYIQRIDEFVNRFGR
ncbi:hypothetical protein [uncultured Ruminococcus sp.]|uniref:hypothetical protein n=1 Tax=uncultured Ruminococcus sp. TaxID=165186 RepID=UPI0026195015|nr:hypothetical protein [uncultured Ruminococcus sp.]